MRVTEDDVRQMFQRMTARRSAENCPDGDSLMRVACGEETEAERESIVEHIARCSDCAREYRIARGMRPATLERTLVLHRAPLAAAAIIIVVIGALTWMVTQRRQPPPSHRVETRMQIGSPIVDLDADSVRGPSPALPSIVVPPSANVFTLILHCPAGMDGVVDVDLDGRSGARASAAGGALTVTLPVESLPNGPHVIHVRAGGRTADFRFSLSHP